MSTPREFGSASVSIRTRNRKNGLSPEEVYRWLDACDADTRQRSTLRAQVGFRSQLLKLTMTVDPS